MESPIKYINHWYGNLTHCYPSGPKTWFHQVIFIIRLRKKKHMDKLMKNNIFNKLRYLIQQGPILKYPDLQCKMRLVHLSPYKVSILPLGWHSRLDWTNRIWLPFVSASNQTPIYLITEKHFWNNQTWMKV